MNSEIERKFLVKDLPDLSRKKSIHYERYFLKVSPDYEERIQRKGSVYELEKKFNLSKLSRKTEKLEISKEQFDKLKKGASKSIIRESYTISKNPSVTVKIYHGDYKGLIRAEVEFKSVKEARIFKPLKWFGKEITNTSLGKDSKLININKIEFKKLINIYKQDNK